MRYLTISLIIKPFDWWLYWECIPQRWRYDFQIGPIGLRINQ